MLNVVVVTGKDEIPDIETWDQSFATVLFKHYVSPLLGVSNMQLFSFLSATVLST